MQPAPAIWAIGVPYAARPIACSAGCGRLRPRGSRRRSPILQRADPDEVPGMTTISEPDRHYDAAYWAKQRVRGAFGGVANLIKFTPYIRETDRVADFGAGGGYLLEHLRCAYKIGVEINPDALADARRRGLRMVESLDAIEDRSIDVFISDNALEHVE